MSQTINVNDIPENFREVINDILKTSKDIGNKGDLIFNITNANTIRELNQGNQQVTGGGYVKGENEKENLELSLKNINVLSPEDFLLALTVTLLNFGEQQLVLDIYKYFVEVKFRKLLNDSTHVQVNGKFDRTTGDNDVEKTEYSKKIRATEVFGTGIKQRLENIGAVYDEAILSTNHGQRRIRNVRFKNQQHFYDMWNIWRDEYPDLLSDIKQEILTLSEYGGFYARILASRTLGEIDSYYVDTAISEYLNDFSRSRDLETRYNVGFTLSAMIANDEKNLNLIFSLLSDWIKREWRSRWTAAAAIGRLYRYDVNASIKLLTEIVKISEKNSREYDLLDMPYLELNPLSMVWHSTSLMFLDGYHNKILDMLYDWFHSGPRHQLVIIDIARELFLDIMQSYFDLRANQLIESKSEEDREKDNSFHGSEFGNEQSSNESSPPQTEYMNEIDSDQESEISTPESVENELQNDEDGLKEVELLDETESNKNNIPISVSENQIEESIESGTENSSRYGELYGLPVEEKTQPIDNDDRSTHINTANRDQPEKHRNNPERDITNDKSIEDIVARIDINSVNKQLWEILYSENNNKRKVGHYTGILVDFAREALKRSHSFNVSNRWFHPSHRKSPYQRMQNIFHFWLVLSKEREFEHIQDTLYTILMETYIGLGEDLRRVKLRDKLEFWYSDKEDKDLYQYTFINEVMLAMDYVSHQIVKKDWESNHDKFD